MLLMRIGRVFVDFCLVLPPPAAMMVASVLVVPPVAITLPLPLSCPSPADG
jgi:hypothetical protein